MRAGSAATLPQGWSYDARSSQLLDEITRLPDHHPTRRERAVPGQRAAQVARATGADTPSSPAAARPGRTRLLLDAGTSSSVPDKRVDAPDRMAR